MKLRRFIFSMVMGCVIAALSLLIEIDSDPFSGVAWRGFPMAIIKRPPFWEVDRAWQLTGRGLGLIISLATWSLLSYPVIAITNKRVGRRASGK